MARMNIGHRKVGPDHPVYVVAELSANHSQDLDKARQLLKAAHHAGADAVKLQTYTPDTMTIDSDKEWFQIPKGSVWEGQTLYDLYEEAYTPWEWYEPLSEMAGELGMDLFSTPFDSAAVDFLESMNTPAHKIASFEIVDHPLLRKIGATGKPVVLSTGMATIAEIDDAVRILRESGNRELALLKCTSAYPAPPEEANLRTIPHLAATFDVVAGLSDHTLQDAVVVGAISVGARIIEKHFTLDRREGGPDASFSLEPDEFRRMVESVRTLEDALGEIRYGPTERQRESLRYRRSLFVVKDLEKGEKLTAENVRSIRPSHGLAPKYFEEVIGRTASRSIERGTPLDWSLIG